MYGYIYIVSVSNKTESEEYMSCMYCRCDFGDFCTRNFYRRLIKERCFVTQTEVDKILDNTLLFDATRCWYCKSLLFKKKKSYRTIFLSLYKIAKTKKRKDKIKEIYLHYLKKDKIQNKLNKLNKDVIYSFDMQDYKKEIIKLNHPNYCQEFIEQKPKKTKLHFCSKLLKDKKENRKLRELVIQKFAKNQPNMNFLLEDKSKEKRN